MEGLADPVGAAPRPPDGPADPVFVAFCAAGLWPGLGSRLAAALEGAGIRCPADVSTAALTRLAKLGAKRAGRLLSSFLAAAPVYEVVELFVPARLDARLAGRTVEAFGPPASRLIRDDPWRLLAVPGVTLTDADRFAVSAVPGVTRDDPRRARALVGYVLDGQSRDGHTVSPRSLVAVELARLGVPDVDAAIGAAVEAATVVVGEGDDPPLALAAHAQAEDAIAQDVARLLATAEPIRVRSRARGTAGAKAGRDPSDTVGGDPGGTADRSPSNTVGGDPSGTVERDLSGIADLDAQQRAAVAHALRGGVSVLTGGPGTGKSHTVAAIVTLATRAGRQVALAAPTGRAAKRLEELCDAPAATLHRLLGAQPRGAGEELSFSGSFLRNSFTPLDEQVVVVDETSMLDVELAEALLDACADGTHLVFVGDPAQLPSIGPGRVLGDLIDSGVAPVTELTTLYRQAEGGAIARLATAVRGGELPPVSDPSHEVVVVPARGSADAAHRVVQLVTDSIPRVFAIPADQVQVVTPVHRGAAGTIALNAALKAVLNPGDGRGRFDVGDRVVATVNHLEAEPFGYANGEVGTVLETAADGALTVDFASGPAEVKGKALADLRHGWAITVHRAQGSEFPAVVVALPADAGRMLSRPLVYTALTRARRHLSVVHAAGPALAHAVRRVGARPRRTALLDRLREYADADAGGGAVAAERHSVE
ncbi:MAG: AAA family ATPase [Actinomycetia bacterium]|nr:AAA family ATPase [Actinomycetes bacterium]